MNILLLILIIMVVISLPTWPHSRSWGCRPSGGLSLLAIVLIVSLLTGRV
jgi:hypothetical protein